MIKLSFYIVDGCEWRRSGLQVRFFKDDAEIDAYIENMWSSMYEIEISKKEYIKEEDQK